jgi:hypothetical protein
MEATINDKKYKFFWSGIFSNWELSTFTVDGITFNCGEQYMMFYKAFLFLNSDIAAKILESTNPKEQKSLGRQVKNFDEKLWSENRVHIMTKGLREKFLQNPKMLSYLRKYKGYEIVEASPYDRIWGIGYHEHDAVENFDNWGTNLLGKILTELANEL